MTTTNQKSFWAAIGLIIALAIFWKPVQGWTTEVLTWVESLGVWAPVVFVGLVALSVPLLLPGLPFTLGAGFIFGVVQGVLLIVIGLSMGGVVAFLLGRYAFQDWARGALERYESMRRIETEVTHGGWKLVMFSRMVPLFPFKVSNYVFGCTRLRCRDYWLGNTLGILPLTFTNVYAGSLAGTLAGAGETSERMGAVQWAMSIGVLVCAGAGVVYIARYARQAMKRYQGDGATNESEIVD